MTIARMRRVTCPVLGCPRRTTADRAMCTQHWRRVPRKLRDQVWAAWRARMANRRDSILIGVHVRALRAAIDAVDAKEAAERTAAALAEAAR
jgi:hypothetical protein